MKYTYLFPIIMISVVAAGVGGDDRLPGRCASACSERMF